MASSSLPPLSLSILGVEPLDEFIKEIADFIHHMIMTRPDMGPDARIEVEAKVGVLKDVVSKQRLALPLLVEASTSSTSYDVLRIHIIYTVLSPGAIDLVFEANMSTVRLSIFYLLPNPMTSYRAHTNTTMKCSTSSKSPLLNPPTPPPN